jgi:hypothetical protein
MGHRSATVVVMGTEYHPIWDRAPTTPTTHCANCTRGDLGEGLIPEILMLPVRDDPIGGFDYEGSAGPG